MKTCAHEVHVVGACDQVDHVVGALAHDDHVLGDHDNHVAGGPLRLRCPAIVLIMIMLQVQVIMMITKLVERNKVKAHQYWPSDGSDNSDIDDPTDHIIDLGDDCKVQFKSSSFQGTYYLR